MTRPNYQTTGERPAGFVAGNYFDKYRSNNPVHRGLVREFLRCARQLLAIARPAQILEVGCGPGDLALYLLGLGNEQGWSGVYIGTDLSPEEILKARGCCPGRSFRRASVYQLPFPDCSFDLVIACELFEHLERPQRALHEVERVCRAHLLLSVPWEPWRRLLNVLRGRYLAHSGNTPGHLQHFSRTSIRRLVQSRFAIVAERRPFPWTMVLAKRRSPCARGQLPVHSGHP
jgi:SAM-dependent methyltransferase